MGENNNAGADETKVEDGAEGQGADDTQAENNGENDGGASDGGAEGDDNTDAGDGDGSGNGDGGDKSDKKDGTDTTKKPTPKAGEEEPKTRKRNADFIIERKEKKIAKLKDKDGAGADDKGDDGADDDGVAPEDEDLINKVVDKRLKPLAERQAREEDNLEITTFIAENPDFKPYADKVRSWAAHPSRAGIPIESLFFEVAGKDLLKIGADRATKANTEAKKNTAGGGNNRGGGQGGTKPVLEMSTEEFEAEQAKVRSKQAE